MYKGVTISELLEKIKSNQSKVLNRVLKDLIKLEAIFFEKDQKDTRIKHIFLSKKGELTF